MINFLVLLIIWYLGYKITYIVTVYLMEEKDFKGSMILKFNFFFLWWLFAITIIAEQKDKKYLLK